MGDFYRFPAIDGLGFIPRDEQIAHIMDEACEAAEAYSEWEAEADIPASVQRVCGSRVAEARREYGMELMDVIHAAETALRRDFDAREAEELRREVIEKNRKRGYYADE